MKGYLALLRRNPGFAKLWAAQAISLLGDWFSTIALSTLVTRFSGPQYAGTAIGLLLLARFFPPLIVGPFAGVLVDRMDRRTLLIVSDVARTALVFGLLLVDSADRLWILYVLTILQFCFTALFEPGRSALLPSLVRGEDLVQANVLGSVTWSVMLAAGAAIGGAVASVFGIRTALMIDAVTFLLSATVIVTIRPRHYINNRGSALPQTQEPTSFPVDELPSVRAPQPEMHVGSATAQQGGGFVAGLRYAAAHPATAAALFIKMGGSVGSIDALMIIYATQLFVLGENGAGSLGLFYAAFGIGAVLGPALLQRVNSGSTRRMRRLIIIGYGFISLGWLLFGSAPTFFLAAVALVVKAMGSSIYWTYSSAIIQKTVPDAYLGRMFSLDLAGFQLMTVISVIITGILADQAFGDGVRVIVLGTGLISLVPLALWSFVVPRLERWEGDHADGVRAPAAGD